MLRAVLGLRRQAVRALVIVIVVVVVAFLIGFFGRVVRASYRRR
jgi:uncharacterized membrane protein YqiK